MKSIVEMNNIRSKYPELAAEWHPEKNGDLTPEQTPPSSKKIVWWLCKEKHEWKARVGNRTRGRGCPDCRRESFVANGNDLWSKCPEIAAEWHPEKNGELVPEQTPSGSSRVVWWLCKEKHEWKARVVNRTRGQGCPDCRRESFVANGNDLRSKYPKLAAEWHPEKNGELVPEKTSPGSTRAVWWLCKDNPTHEWKARVGSRTQGSGCPDCRSESFVANGNDLRSKYPKLAAEWHPEKNGELVPEQTPPGTTRIVWWLCKEKHEWKSSVRNRTRVEICPDCRRESFIANGNDLRSKYPKLAAEWHPEKNGELVPEQTPPGTSLKIWWLCKDNSTHEWKARVVNRTQGRGCPNCRRESFIANGNDLRSKYPEIAAEWHPEKNGELVPEQTPPGTSLKVWWEKECLPGVFHEWEAIVGNRVLFNYGCSVCTGRSILVGHNDLGTTHPIIAAELHPTKNGPFTAQDFTAGMNKKVWWEKECASGVIHEWEAAIRHRTRANTGCPLCQAGKTEKLFREAFEKHTGYSLPSSRISLLRTSRKSAQAQIDMLNYDLKLSIEYDGEFAHGENALYRNTLEQRLAEDKETTQALIDIGYKVIRVREHSRDNKLPFVPLDPEYESCVFQVTYKSYGKDRDTIEELVQNIIEEKNEWFKQTTE